MILDITFDVLPQFFKHLVRIESLFHHKVGELNEWIAQSTENEKEKKKVLLFGKSTLKHKK